jgi:pimeloyl-ACP methyl ester carboxylesterase
VPYAKSDDAEIFYETFGERGDPALVLINGLGSQCINYRVEWCEKFVARGFFVVRFDNRDVGLSTKFDQVEPDVAGVSRAAASGQVARVPYVLADMAGDAIAVADQLGIDRFHVVGASMGGMIVQVLAIAHPDRLLSLTSVMSTTGDADVGHPSEEARRLLLQAPPTDRDGYISHYLQGLRAWGSPACYDEERLSTMAAEAYDRCVDPAGRGRQLMAVIASPSRTEALSKVRVPALVVHGDADKLIDQSGGRRTAEAIPNARLEIIQGMGHDYPPQYWDRWVDLITDHARAASGSRDALA